MERTDRYTLPLSDAGFAQALNLGATNARHAARVTLTCEPIGMGQHALVVTVTPAKREATPWEEYRRTLVVR